MGQINCTFGSGEGVVADCKSKKEKEKKIQGVLNPKILGRGRGRGLRDQMQNYEENVQLHISGKKYRGYQKGIKQ